jgi:hypothetical protein
VLLRHVCGDYIKKSKNAQKDIKDLNGEINSLKSILESLVGVLRGPGGEKLIALQNIPDDVGKCKVILEDLSDKINPATTQSSIRWLRWWGFRHWEWPLQRHDIDEAISQLNGYTSLFVAASQIDNVWVAAQICCFFYTILTSTFT